MQQKTPDEFFRGDGHDFHFVSIRVIPPSEGDASILHIQNSVVGNRHPVGIASQIRNDFIRRSKRRLAVHDPLPLITGVQYCFVRIRQFLFQQRQNFPRNFAERTRMGRKNFFFDSRHLLSAVSQSAARNDHMNVRVKQKILAPGMQHSGYSGLCAEILFIGAQFQNDFRGRLKQQRI